MMRRATLIVAIAGMVARSLAGQATPAHTGIASLAQMSGEIQSLSRRASPAVVQIVVTGYGSLERGSDRSVSVLGRQESTASGVIVDPSGYIVTNAHVVRGDQDQSSPGARNLRQTTRRG